MTAPQIDHCNFFGNAVYRRSFFLAETQGMSVSYCVFNGDITLNLVYLYSGAGFTIEDCKFTSEVPSGPAVASATRNEGLVNAPSNDITHLGVEYCPSGLPAMEAGEEVATAEYLPGPFRHHGVIVRFLVFDLLFSQ
jgi:hypothetical protein